MAKGKVSLGRLVATQIKLIRTVTAGWAPYRESATPADELAFQMSGSAIPSLGFFLMLGLSAVIATLGLIADSAPAIIGAMIIAPLMAPIVSMAFGIACADFRLMALSAMTILSGTVLVVAIAFFGVRIVGAQIAGSEILARTTPSHLDLVIALAAGCAGAFAQTRKSILNSIAGVAIAVALVPPLAVTGIGLSLGGRAISETGASLGEVGLHSGGSDIAAGAFLLFLTNLIGIVVVAALVFLIQRYGQWKKAIVLIAVVVAGSFGMMPTLNTALREIYVENRVARLTAQYIREPSAIGLYGSEIQIEGFTVVYVDDVLHVSVDARATRDRVGQAQERLDGFRRRLSDDLGEPVVVELDLIPIEVMHLRSAPAAAEQ